MKRICFACALSLLSCFPEKTPETVHRRATVAERQHRDEVAMGVVLLAAIAGVAVVFAAGAR